MSEEDHKDISIGIYLFCMMLGKLEDEPGWHMKIWESCEALIPYTFVLDVPDEQV